MSINKPIFLYFLIFFYSIISFLLFFNFSKLDFSVFSSNTNHEDEQIRIIEELKDRNIQNNLSNLKIISSSLDKLKVHSSRFIRPSLLSFTKLYQVDLNNFNHSLGQINRLKLNTNNISNLIKQSNLDPKEKEFIFDELLKISSAENKMIKLDEVDEVLSQKKKIFFEQKKAINLHKIKQLSLSISQIKLLIFLHIALILSISFFLGFSFFRSRNNKLKLSTIQENVFLPIEGKEILLSFLLKEISDLNFHIWEQGVWPSNPSENFKLTNLLLFQCLTSVIPKLNNPASVFYSCSFDGHNWSIFVIFEQPLMSSSSLHFKILEDYLSSIGGDIEYSAIPQTKIKIQIT